MLPSEITPRLIELPQGPLAVAEEGAGPPLLLIHGLPGSHRDLRHLSPHLAHRFRVLRPDLPGFGDSPLRDRAQLSPAGRAEALSQLCAALRLERPLILGHSMGGVVALAAVARDPERYAGLALLSTPGLRPHRVFARTPAPTLSRLLACRPLRPLLMPLVRRAFWQAGFRKASDRDLRHTLGAMAQVDFAAHAARVAACRLPTLVAWCADDPLVEPALLDALAEACPPGPRHRWPTGGHNPQKTQAPALAAALGAWADALGLPAPG